MLNFINKLEWPGLLLSIVKFVEKRNTKIKYTKTEIVKEAPSALSFSLKKSLKKFFIYPEDIR